MTDPLLYRLPSGSKFDCLSRARRWLRALTICLGLLSLPHQNLSAQSTLNNPGLEGTYQPLTECARIQGEVAPGWLDNTCWDATARVIYSLETQDPHSGAAAQRIEVQAGRVQFAQALTLQADRRYVVQIWLRAAAPLPVEILLRKQEAPYTTYASVAVDLSSSWQRYTLSGLAANDQAYLMIVAYTPGSFWVDDVELSSTPYVHTLPDHAVARSFFGMHIHNAQIAWPAVQRRIGAIRLWDADPAQWAEVNPQPGIYEWAGLDAHVERALANRADLVFNLGRTPQWASARPTEVSPYGPGQAAEPAKASDWQTWVRAVGERYRGQIRYWEIWNEPNDAQFFSGTPEKLVELTRQAHAILKEIDPANQIVSPSPYNVTWLDRFLELGGGAYVDVIGYHFYIDQAPEFLFTTYIPSVRLVLEKHGLLHKPLWNTESGWLRPTPFGPKTLSPTVGAGYLARSFILNWASGISRYYYYAWDNHSHMDIDLTESDRVTLTPAAIAYREIARWLIGAQLSELMRTADDTWTVKLIRPDGSNAYILWNPTRTSSLTIPATWPVTRQRTLAGGVSSLAGFQKVEVTALPILLEEGGTAEQYLPLIQQSGLAQLAGPPTFFSAPLRFVAVR